MLIELTPVDGIPFEIEESNIFLAENDGDNVVVSHKHPDTLRMQRVLVTDTIDELNDTSVAAGGVLFGTKIYTDSTFTEFVDVLMSQEKVSKVYDTNPCEVNYNLGSASIHEILYHRGNKASFLADYNGDYSPTT